MIFKKDTTAAQKGNTDFSISFIQLSEIDFMYTYRPSNHLYQAYIKQTDASLSVANNLISIQLASDLQTDEILINENSFMQNKDVKLTSTLTYDTESEIFTVKPSTIKINAADYTLQGFYDIKKSLVDLSFNAEKNNISSFTSILPRSMTQSIQEYQSMGNIHFNGSIKGLTKEGESPAIVINFGFDNTSFFHPTYKQEIKNAFLKGTFSNGSKHDLTTSSVQLSDIKAEIDGKPLKDISS